MANFDTGLDVLDNVLSRSDELGVGLADREEDAKKYVQASYISLLTEGYPWIFARKDPPGVLTTLAESTGAASITQGSVNVTFAVAPSVSLEGYKFFFETDAVLYRVATHTALSVNATLDSVYLGDNVTSGNYRAYQDEYDLAADFLRPVNRKFLRRMDGIGSVELISKEEFDGRTQNKLLWSGTDYPHSCCFISNTKIKIHPWTTQRKRFEYSYIYHPGQLIFDGTANDTLIIQPPEDRVIVALLAIGNLLVDKNDDRATTFLEAAVSKVNAMKRLQTSQSRARMWVSPGFNVGTIR